MINKKELINILKENGWRCKKDCGDYYCLLTLQDRDICILPGVRNLLDSVQLLSFSESISTKEFCEANNFIFNEKEDYKILVQPWNSEFRLKSKTLGKEDVLELIDGIIKWSKEQDLELALEKYRNNRPDRPGGSQLKHLAALAMAGDVETLKSYQRSFMKNDCLNFVPMITSDVIDRSVELAIKYKQKNI